MNTSYSPRRCGIVLAGGEGKRLQPLVKRLRGDALPKQYVNFIGSRSMIEHTFSRVERMIRPKRLFTVVNRDHLRHPEVNRQLCGRPSETLIVQPENKETGPGLLLPLAHLFRYHPDSAVAVFPSDHFILEERLFMEYVDLAFRVVERDHSRVVILAVEPEQPEPEYGYIVPDKQVQHLAPLPVRHVSRFIEKPDARVAETLALQGGLWNTMVMVFHITAMMELVRAVSPLLYATFFRIGRALGTTREREVVEEEYRHMRPMNFSKEVLETLPLEHVDHLAVLPIRGLSWSDWGSEQRIVSVLSKLRRLRQVGELQVHKSPRTVVPTEGKQDSV